MKTIKISSKLINRIKAIMVNKTNTITRTKVTIKPTNTTTTKLMLTTNIKANSTIKTNKMTTKRGIIKMITNLTMTTIMILTITETLINTRMTELTSRVIKTIRIMLEVIEMVSLLLRR